MQSAASPAEGFVPEKCDGKILKSWDDEDAGTFHSRLLWLDSACGERVAAIRSIVGRDTLDKRFVLRDSIAFAAGRELPTELQGATILSTPLRRVVALSSSHIGYILRLGAQNSIVAVGEGRYIADSALYYRVEAAKGGKMQRPANPVAEVGYGIDMDLEKLMTLKPDLIMTFSSGGSQDDYRRLDALKLPVMLTSEWQESGVLEKAYWLKLYGALFGKEALADSILKGVQVEALREEARNCKGRRVLAGMSHGGVWYAPGGLSYTADLIRRSGGCYLWDGDSSREIRLTLEEVLVLSDSIDLWINPGMYKSPGEILGAEPRVGRIKAFRNQRVFQNDGCRGPAGGNDFYEGAVARPAELVSNLGGLILKDYLLPEGASRDNQKSSSSLTLGSPSPDGEKQGEKGGWRCPWYHNIF